MKKWLNSLRVFLAERWELFWDGRSNWPGLTVDESEEYDMLGECMEWRALSESENGRFWELHRKVGEYGRWK